MSINPVLQDLVWLLKRRANCVRQRGKKAEVLHQPQHYVQFICEAAAARRRLTLPHACWKYDHVILVPALSEQDYVQELSCPTPGIVICLISMVNGYDHLCRRTIDQHHCSGAMALFCPCPMPKRQSVI